MYETKDLLRIYYTDIIKDGKKKIQCTLNLHTKLKIHCESTAQRNIEFLVDLLIAALQL